MSKYIEVRVSQKMYDIIQQAGNVKGLKPARVADVLLTVALTEITNNDTDWGDYYDTSKYSPRLRWAAHESTYNKVKELAAQYNYRIPDMVRRLLSKKLEQIETRVF